MGFKRWQIITLILATLAICSLIVGWHYYTKIFSPNVTTQSQETYLYIKTGATFDDVLKELESKKLLKNIDAFVWVADLKKYSNKVKPGKYLLTSGMNNNELVNLLRSGEQTPVRITFNNIRYTTELAGIISKEIEADSAEIVALLSDADYLKTLDLTPESALLLCVPNTYEFFWNTDAKKFVQRMQKEFDAFWNPSRLELLKSTGLTRIQAGVLASIVQSETNKTDEMPRVAGVYINRIHKNMLLQADPTLIFALGDFTIKRVLNVHKEVDSPYNTYKYTGLPPGPICMPNTKTIDQVLNFERHDFVYFCAKEDLSGYHNFSKTVNEHLVNARKYQQELNRRKILK